MSFSDLDESFDTQLHYTETINATFIDFLLFWFTYPESPWNSMLNKGKTFKDKPSGKLDKSWLV